MSNRTVLVIGLAIGLPLAALLAWVATRPISTQAVTVDLPVNR